MKLLVVGASGLVGGELVRRARARGHDVVGAARSVLGEATRTVDLLDRRAVRDLFTEAASDVVVVAAAWPWVDGCQRDPARSERENVDTVRVVIDAAPAAARVVFYSTDHVFDGTKPGGAPYVESDPPNPLSVYASHKRAAEELLLARGRALVARTAWVFGAELRQKNFVYRVVEHARAGKTLRVPAGQAGCPTWAGWLADATLTLLDREVEGVVHLTGREPHTKAEWARTVARALELPALDVVETTATEAGQVAPRPDRVVLASERHDLVHPPLAAVLRDRSVAPWLLA